MAQRPNKYNADRKVFVLCFDGTGNKFEATDSESNILKIYRLLDRSQPNLLAYYQPGIGTYSNTLSFDHTGRVARLKSWYEKTKDAAVGSNLAQHVMAGYRFLQRYYTPEDDIFMFGFSRGAYTAKLLAEMLDHVGLLSAGNEELMRFAWKYFSKWQTRRAGSSPDDKERESRIYNLMENFRETFSRPVRRIRFLGLFDTVNSVPRFENAWMQRTEFPYTCRSSAKVIRHAVAINERRAKFRQDLMSEKDGNQQENNAYAAHRHQSDFPGKTDNIFTGESSKDAQRNVESHDGPPPNPPTFNINVIAGSGDKETEPDDLGNIQKQAANAAAQPGQLDTLLRPQGRRESSFTRPVMTHSMEDLNIHNSPRRKPHVSRRFGGSSKRQDIVECWFPGNHADIGGGWHQKKDEAWSLSHVPLVWMVHEAEQAGLNFDPHKVAGLNCCRDEIDEYGNTEIGAREKQFLEALHLSSTEGIIHDCLTFGGGLPTLSVLSWKAMERLPFRRMDMQEDGRWKPIRWPLPLGEVRDIPAQAKIHVSAIKRMRSDKTYRPSNLIFSGSPARELKTVPEEYGIGEWEVIGHEGNPVCEMYTKRKVIGDH